MKFTLSVKIFPGACNTRTSAWPPSLPSVPTSRATRVTSDANELNWSTMVLIGVLQLQNFALDIHGNFLGQISVRNGCRYVCDVAHLVRQIACHEVHAVGQIFPGSRDTVHFRLSAQFSFGTHFARHTRHFRSERIQLVHHRVDGVLQFENFAFDVDRDLSSTSRRSRPQLSLPRCFAPGRQVAGHEVHAVRQILPGTSHALHICLSAQFPFRTHFPRHTGYFRCER